MGMGSWNTNRFSEATGYLNLPQTEVWGFITITALRADGFFTITALRAGENYIKSWFALIIKGKPAHIEGS